MKLREAAIRLTLDDWINGSGQGGRGYVARYPLTTYWYGSNIYVCTSAWGVSLAERNTGYTIHPFWPDPCRLSVAHLCKLDADIADARHEEIISILLAFQKEVQ